MEKLYLDSKPIIDRAVSSVMRKNRLEREEILSEANLIFCQCAENFDPKIGKFENFLSNSLYFGLYTKCRELSGEQRRREGKNHFWERRIIVDIDDFQVEDKRQENVNSIIDATILNMSQDSQDIVDIFFNPPTEIKKKEKENFCKRLKKEDLYKYLRSIGWERKRILLGFTEIKKGLNEVWV
ncbi:MAG: hypothetical protein GY853_01590 [PVC group bacterium]|nr:hypothetical protein [PVC group bacterium]